MTDVSHRRGTLTVTLTRPDGSPAAHQPVAYEQRRHAFGFGNIGFDFIEWVGGAGDQGNRIFGGASTEAAERTAEAWLELNNQATLPFYWRGFEPRRGVPDTARLRATAEWLTARGVAIKGHPLVWHTLAPEWLQGLDDSEVEATVRARIVREATEFAGLIDLWDVVNEPVILPVFTAEDNAWTRLVQRRGRLPMLRMAYETAREANPAARLVLNDFDLSPAFERVIEECLDAGLPIDAIGLQTHMHQGYRGESQVRSILDRFARFGLPLQMTETTLVSGHLMPPDIVDLNDYQIPDWPSTPEGEERQAQEIVRHYRSLVEHPAVESVTYWGMLDEGAWLGAPAGLIRRDGTRKPAFDALRDLIKGEWWTPRTEATTDEHGRLTVEGFAGDYEIRAGAAAHGVEVERGRATETTLVVP